MKIKIAVVFIFIVPAFALLFAYRVNTAVAAAYSQGWSDAHCGTGVDCEAGQE